MSSSVQARAEAKEHDRRQRRGRHREEKLRRGDGLALQVTDDDRQRRDECNRRHVREDSRDEGVTGQANGDGDGDEGEFLERAREHRADERRGEEQGDQRQDGCDGDQATDGPLCEVGQANGNRGFDSHRPREVRQGLPADNLVPGDRRDQKQFAPAVQSLGENRAPVGLNQEVHGDDEDEREHQRLEGKRWRQL
jgi:hypothetical protein